MRLLIPIATAIVGLLVIAGYHLAPWLKPGLAGDFALSQLAAFGLSLVGYAILVWLTGKARKHTDRPAEVIVLTGVLMGAAAGVIVAALVEGKPSLPLPPELVDIADAVRRADVYRFERIVAFGALIGGGMFVWLELLAQASDRSVIPRAEQILSMVAAFSATFIVGVWVSRNVSDTGAVMHVLTGGFIDWIGAGLCESHARVPANCGLVPPLDKSKTAAAMLAPLNNTSSIAAAMLGLYFFFVALWQGRRWRLSFARSVIMVGSVVVAGVILYELVRTISSWMNNGDLNKGNPLLFLLGMSMYATLFSFWITWSRNHSLIEALSRAFGSTDNFRQMVDQRLRPNFEIPPRGKTLDGEVRAVVDQAECNGWLDGLIVSARQSRPGNLALARIADRLGLGIKPASAGNVAKVVEATGATGSTKGTATPAATAERLETVIRQFSALSPDERRERQARLEARICKVMTPRNEGTGWLVGPDLVLTNYHVVKDMVGDNPTVFGQDVVCGFDYKESRNSVLEGVRFGLHPERPVVDWSPYSHFDTSDTDEVPSPEELDFALLRLAHKAGELPIGVKPEAAATAEKGAALRGWIAMKSALKQPDPGPALLEQKMLLYVLQHPYGGPLKEEYGALTAVNRNGTRVRHEVTTERGSSGSPCFNLADFEPFALHHAGGHSRTLNLPYNQAIPIGLILRYLKTRGKVEPFWDLAPGTSEKAFGKR